MTGHPRQARHRQAMLRPPWQSRARAVISRLPEWVRLNSQKYLLEAAQEPLARRYLGRPGPVSRPGPQVFFWKRIFVPIYRLLPWEWRRAIILAMPGSHRHGWPPHAQPPSPASRQRSAAQPGIPPQKEGDDGGTDCRRTGP